MKSHLDNPVCLSRVCGHICVANGVVLELASVTRETEKSLPRGARWTDERGGPIDVLRKSSVELIRRVIPAPDLRNLRILSSRPSGRLWGGG